MIETKNLRVTLYAIAIVALAGNTFAQDTHVGPYIGAGASIAFEDFDLPPGVSADDTFALDLMGGYRMSSLVALEGELELLTDFDLDGIGDDVDGFALTGSAKIFPLQGRERVEPFVLGGLGYLDLDGPSVIDADESDWMLLIGGGVDFPIGERSIFEVKAAYHLPQGDVDDFEYWTLGANVQYRF
jgi:hypothetical protein